MSPRVRRFYSVMMFLKNSSRYLGAIAFTTTLAWMLQMEGCSTSEVHAPPIGIPPAYTQVPHPQGNSSSDIKALFLGNQAPDADVISKDCDKDFRKLIGLTQSINERTEGIRELVKQDPVTYHWCFYGKMLTLETEVKKDTFIDEKQKIVLDGYEFLVPIAKAFSAQYHDTRYLRIALNRYKKLSEWLFYRRLDLTPEGTVELVQPENPFGVWRENEGGYAILDKYHLSKPAADPAAPANSTPASVAPVPLPTALETPSVALPQPLVKPSASQTVPQADGLQPPPPENTPPETPPANNDSMDPPSPISPPSF